jgi:hypothetical protein
MLQVAIVDDELNNVENLSFILTHDCNDVHIVFKTTSPFEAKSLLENASIDALSPLQGNFV